MKKTLIALAVTAMIATSANAAVIYQHEGTKVDLDGRGALEIVKLKGKRTDLVDRGSRVRVRAYQEIGGGFTALSAVELRFTRGGNVGNDIHTKRLFGGFSHKDVGTLTFGRQLTLGDHIPKANYSYELSGNVLHDQSEKAAHFMSNKFAGFRFSTDYYFGTADKSQPANGQGFGVGAFYDGQWNDFAVRFGSGYIEVKKGTTLANEYKQKIAGVGFDVKYKIVSIGLDWAHGKSPKGHKDYNFKHSSAVKYEKVDRFDLGFKIDLTEKNAFYGSYLWGTGKNIGQADGKYRGWTLGIDHKFNKYVAVYLEGAKAHIKEDGKKVSDASRIGLGTRITF